MLSVDSDYLLLEVKPSTIPGAGLGVFAKTDFESGIILAEYRGIIILNNEMNVARYSDKCLELNKEVSIVGCNCIACLINDAIQFKEIYTGNEIAEIRKNNSFPLYPDKDYNCVYMNTFSKIFVMSIRSIKQGEELFCNYGTGYWLERAKIIDS